MTRPPHRCEGWQIRDDGEGPHCMACGMKKPGPAEETPSPSVSADLMELGEGMCGKPTYLPLMEQL